MDKIVVGTIENQICSHCGDRKKLYAYETKLSAGTLCEDCFKELTGRSPV